MPVPDVGPKRAFDSATLLAILKYYSTHASAIAAVVAALILILSGDQAAGTKALFQALLAVFAGTTAIGLAAGNNDASARLQELESRAPQPVAPRRA